MVDLRFDVCAAAEEREFLLLPLVLGDRAPSLAAEVALEGARDVRWIGRKMEYFCLEVIVVSLSTRTHLNDVFQDDRNR